MSKKDEMSDLEEIEETIEYFENFIGATESFANEAHIDEAYELEAPCRAAVHHINTLLDYIRSAKEDILAEIPAEKVEKKIPHLEIVR